jgi:hypothetical protein
MKGKCPVCGQVIEIGGNGVLLPHPRSDQVLKRDGPTVEICSGGAQDWAGTPPLTT